MKITCPTSSAFEVLSYGQNHRFSALLYIFTTGHSRYCSENSCATQKAFSPWSTVIKKMSIKPFKGHLELQTRSDMTLCIFKFWSMKFLCLLNFTQAEKTLLKISDVMTHDEHSLGRVGNCRQDQWGKCYWAYSVGCITKQLTWNLENVFLPYVLSKQFSLDSIGVTFACTIINLNLRLKDIERQKWEFRIDEKPWFTIDDSLNVGYPHLMEIEIVEDYKKK